MQAKRSVSANEPCRPYVPGQEPRVPAGEFGKDNDDRGREPDCPQDTISFYFNSIRKYPLLTPKEEKSLAARISKGDMDARRRMIESNLRLVVNIARRYINRGLALQDMIEEGNIGLIKAVERFKASKDCKFSTYATYWIRQSVERGIANHANTVRLPIHVTADISKLTRASRELMMTLNREPEAAELAGKTGFSGRYIKKLDLMSKKNLSLDSMPPDGSDQPLIERMEGREYPAAADFIDESRRSEKINNWLKTLDDKEEKILRMRFGFCKGGPKTLDAIGRSFGVTRERVRQIEIKGMDKLKKLVEDSHISFDDAI